MYQALFEGLVEATTRHNAFNITMVSKDFATACCLSTQTYEICMMNSLHLGLLQNPCTRSSESVTSSLHQAQDDPLLSRLLSCCFDMALDEYTMALDEYSKKD